MIPTFRTLAEVGGSPGVQQARRSQLEKARAALGRAAECAFFVPGRIEVLGKHTDYAGGRSLLCAVERGFVLAAAAAEGREIRVTNVATGESLACEISPDVLPPSGQWANYPLTVIRRLARNFPSFGRGATLAFTSDLPQAAGLSSSSALLVAVYLALAEVNGLEETEGHRGSIHSLEDLAGYLATIENGRSFGALRGDEGVGTLGGSEDHTAILCCQAGCLSQYRFAPAHLERRIDLDEPLVFVVADSGVEARKTGEARERYNRASRLASRVLDVWRRESETDPTTLAAAAEEGPDARRRIREALARSGDAEFTAEALVDRFDQFCAESLDIVPAAADALACGDTLRFGTLVDRSQQGAERWLGNQVPETVALAASARAHGALAASAFGAGFGGSVWALVPRADEGRFTDAWSRAYKSRFPERAGRARFLSTRPGPAAFRLAPGS